jgi:hypothetical protein
MNEIIKQDILFVLKNVVKSLRGRNINELYELSNETIHNSSIFQDQDSLQIAVLVYSLSKIINRKGFDRRFPNYAKDAYFALKRNNIEKYRAKIGNIFDLINKTDENIGLYVMKVINEAKIKKGSKIYDHGISMSRASSMLGISQWELMNYVGKTNLEENASADIKERLKFARSLFGI